MRQARYGEREVSARFHIVGRRLYGVVAGWQTLRYTRVRVFVDNYVVVVILNLALRASALHQVHICVHS